MLLEETQAKQERVSKKYEETLREKDSELEKLRKENE